MSSKSSNKLNVPEARAAMDKFKMEAASEVGVDLKEGYKFNFAKAPVVDRDESVAFRTGSTVYRAMALADGKPTGKGIVRYTVGS